MTTQKLAKFDATIAALQAKIAEAQASRAALATDMEAAERASNIDVGANVSFVFGRGETKSDLTGQVIAVVPTEQGKLLKVLAGEGKGIKVYDVASKNATVVPAAGALNEQDVPVALPGEPTVDVSLVNAQAAAADMGINLDDALQQSPLQGSTADDVVAGL